MKIVLIGPDGVGKSTLAQVMSERFTMPVYSGTGSHKYKANRMEIISGWDEVILDRLYCIDEIVYRRAYGTGSEVEFDLYEYMPMMLDTSQWYIIYVDNIHAEELLEARGDESVKPEDLEAIREAYDVVLKAFKIPHIRFDLDFTDKDEHERYLETALGRIHRVMTREY